jgi:PAS domain S-box-containing protein
MEVLFAEVPDVIARLRADGTILFVSPSVEAVLGYRPDELVGRRIDELALVPEVEGEPVTATRSIPRQGGGSIWVEISWRSYRNAAGVVEIAAVVRAISARRRAETMLEAEKLIFERIARGAPLGEVLALMCRTFEQQSPTTMCSVLDEQGGRLVTVAGPSLPAGLLEALAGGLEIGPGGGACGNAASRRERVICADVASDPIFAPYRDLAAAHGILACWSTPILAPDGGLLGTFAVYDRHARVPETGEIELIDRLVHLAGIAIERHRVTEALRASDDRHRSVLNGLEEVIFQTDAGGRFAFLSAAFTAVTGCPVDEGLGRAAVELVHPGDRARWLELLRPGFERASGEVRILRPDGDKRWVRVQARALAGGGVSGALTDITERKELEAQLLVSDRMASMGTLVAGVAHEINNPLASVMLNLDYLAREVANLIGRGGADPGRLERLQEPLRAANEGAERVRDIVRNLKIFSRGDERKRPVDLHHVLESTLRLAANELKHRAHVVKDYGRVPVIEANEAGLGQVFLNLLVNAAQAIPEGNSDGNTIRVTAFTDEDGNAVVEVADTGAGIPPESLGRIFDPFFTTKPIGVGTGLGLSICHRIITALGGTISVESHVGAGTTFRVMLPPSEDRLTMRRAPSAPGTPMRRGRILIIDDEPIVGAAVKRLFSSDHDVTHVSSGEEALARFAAGERYDVILCDLMMPRMTGMQLHEELARTAADQAGRVVFITGGAFTPRAKKFLAEVPNAVLEKPFDYKLLLNTINEKLR